MINNFLRAPQANSLAVLLLINLVITWLTSLFLSLREVPVKQEKGWYATLLPIVSLLGIPAALDLIQIQGIEFLLLLSTPAAQQALVITEDEAGRVESSLSE